MKTFALAMVTLLPLAGAEVPRPAPQFSIKMPNGGETSFGQYRGKVLCVEFLFTTCPHCQEASRLMSRLQTEYGSKGFQALGVAFNEMAGMLVPDFVREFNVNYPVGYSDRLAVHTFLQNNPDYALHVPQLVFIDKKGVIRQQSQPRGDTTTATEANIRKMIETLLAEPGPDSKVSAKKKAS